MHLDFTIEVQELQACFLLSPMETRTADGMLSKYLVAILLKELPQEIRDQYYFDKEDDDTIVGAVSRDRPNLITTSQGVVINSSLENIGPVPPTRSIIGLLSEYSMQHVEKALNFVPCKLALMACRKFDPIRKRDYTNLRLNAIGFDYEALRERVAREERQARDHNRESLPKVSGWR